MHDYALILVGCSRQWNRRITCLYELERRSSYSGQCELNKRGDTMKVLRSPILWGIVVGVAVGGYGIPVLLPNTTNQWVWTSPAGFAAASIFAFGTLGFLFGSFIQEWFNARNGGGNAMWGYGLCSLALLIGLIGFYRFEAANADTMWNQVSTGLGRTFGAATNLSNGHPSQDTIRAQGTSLIMAAADIGGAGRYFGRHRQTMSMERVSSALTQAGDYLVALQNEQQVIDVEKFIDQSKAVIQDSLRANHNTYTPASMQEILDKVSALIPPEFQQDWFAN